MFISKEQALALTGYEVTSEVLIQAQGIIEAYTGKVEAEIDDASDLAQLGKATAYQAAYMKENPELVFEQMAVSQIGQFGQVISFRYGDTDSPFVSPLAKIACRSLTWRRARAINTGSMFGMPTPCEGWEYQ